MASDPARAAQIRAEAIAALSWHSPPERADQWLKDMPDGLEQAMTVEEFRDLLPFLEQKR